MHISSRMEEHHIPICIIHIQKRLAWSFPTYWKFGQMSIPSWILPIPEPGQVHFCTQFFALRMSHNFAPSAIAVVAKRLWFSDTVVTPFPPPHFPWRRRSNQHEWITEHSARESRNLAYQNYLCDCARMAVVDFPQYLLRIDVQNSQCFVGTSQQGEMRVKLQKKRPAWISAQDVMDAIIIAYLIRRANGANTFAIFHAKIADIFEPEILRARYFLIRFNLLRWKPNLMHK